MKKTFENLFDSVTLPLDTWRLEKQLKITRKTASRRCAHVEQLSQCAVAQSNFPAADAVYALLTFPFVSLDACDAPATIPSWQWANWHWLMPDPSRARGFSFFHCCCCCFPWAARSWRRVWVNVLLSTLAKLFVWFLFFYKQFAGLFSCLPGKINQSNAS